MKPLEIEVQKTTKQFLDNYSKHDLAGIVVRELLKSKGFIVIPYGEDRRFERIWEAGEDRPNALIWKKGAQLIFIDWKGHETRKWILNERAYNSYVDYGAEFNLPVFCIWLVIPERKLFYARLPFRSPKQEFMPHDQNYVIEASDWEIRDIDNLFDELGLEKQGRLT